MQVQEKISLIADAVATIADGASLAIGGRAGQRIPMALIREIARQRKTDLRVISLGGAVHLDVLAAAGCIGALDCSADEARAAEIQASTSTHGEHVMFARYRAASAGIPFVPLEAAVDHAHDAWVMSVADPFTGRPSAVVAALRPDVAIIHAHMADAFGNVSIDADCSNHHAIDMDMARAAASVIVSVEQIVSAETIRRRPHGTVLAGKHVTRVVEAPYGAHPGRCHARYACDETALAHYRLALEDTKTFAAWLRHNVFELADHGDYLARIGAKRLFALTESAM
jgi:glutaconate CoA-transferase subunit A